MDIEATQHIRLSSLRGGVFLSVYAFRIGCLHLQRFCGFLLKAVDAAFRIYKLLAACKERMAARANFNADIALMAGARTELIAARTDYADLLVVGVDSGFHLFVIPFEVGGT
jgi:hypothetical protein